MNIEVTARVNKFKAMANVHSLQMKISSYSGENLHVNRRSLKAVTDVMPLRLSGAKMAQRRDASNK